MRRIILPTFLLMLGFGPESRAAGPESPRVRLAPGFRIEAYADETLANDIQAMTLDRRGRVVVTGPGYVKTLHDDPTTGRAGGASVFATPKSGGMGMCFVGDDLLITADHWLLHYRDADGDGRADGPPEKVVPLATAEHGGHAIRKGPDGWIYVIGGNDAGIDARHVGTRDSPVVKPVAGAILRLSPDLKTCEVVAHGFRNPYDFDFNPLGDLFTYDSDCERDENLPWYTPTRAFHVAEGGHHGWRLKGYQRSFARSPDLFDAIPPLAELGRGSPTGVVCYRHTLFPESYRGGLFLADWTFGRIYFLPLDATPEAYRTRSEVFLEPIGGDGFAPTDLCVAPDGALLVCIGGRKTRGAVFRITPVTEGEAPKEPASDLDRVLSAPQPLDAWSRDRWEPIARRLGPGPFEAVLKDDSRGEAGQTRAIEVLADLFDGFDVDVAESAWKATKSDALRARIAWALERRRAATVRPSPLDGGSSSEVGLWTSLYALAARGRVVGADYYSPERLWLAPARIAAAEQRYARAEFPGKRRGIKLALGPQTPRALIHIALVVLHEGGLDDAEGHALRSAIWALDRLGSPTNNVSDVRFEDVPDEPSARPSPSKIRIQDWTNAFRLAVVALGDWDLDHAEADAFVPYTLARPIDFANPQVAAILEQARRLFPSGSDRIDFESSRLLAMLGDDREATRRAVAAHWTATSTATSDLHYLIVYARLHGPIPPELTPKVAEALCRLDSKLGGKPGRIKQTWNDRVGEVTAALAKSDPHLADALIARPDFATPDHAAWARQIGHPEREPVARAFLAASTSDPSFDLSGPVLEILDGLPRDRVKPLLRARWDGLAVKDDALIRLADGPEAADRRKFLEGLDSNSPGVAAACLGALEGFSPTREPADLVPGLRLIRRLAPDPKSKPLRLRVASWISRQRGGTSPIAEPAEPAKVVAHYSAMIDAFARQHPSLAPSLSAPGDEDPAAWGATMTRVDWTSGDPGRGAAVFRSRQCASCHEGPAAIGPDLAGVGRRLSRDDLFASIVAPARDVAPAYLPTLVETVDGRTIAGFVVFESAEGLIVRTGPSTTERIDGPSIASRRVGTTSLMPAGLLRGAGERELSDLYAYLKSL